MAGHVKVASPKVRKRLRRKVHIRLRVHGTPDRPRLSVFRSTRYVYAQGKPKKERARLVGKTIGEKLVGAGIKAVVFDRNGFIYHGRVKEIADGARDAGLQF
jgi:large subunit ribosomal protein L18